MEALWFGIPDEIEISTVKMNIVLNNQKLQTKIFNYINYGKLDQNQFIMIWKKLLAQSNTQ